MRDFTYIIKRVIIGVSIALILMAIKGTLFTRVSAQSYVVGDIAIQTPTNSPVNDYNNIFFTNIDYDSSKDFTDYTALSYTLMGTDTSASGISSGCNSRAFINVNESVPVTTSCSSGLTGATITKFNIGLGGASGFNHLEFDKPYSIALEFTKDSQLSWTGIVRNASQYLRFNVYDHDTSTLLEDVTFFSDVSYVFFEVMEEDTPTNKGYLIIRFTPSSDDFPYSSTHISLNSIEYDSSAFVTSHPSYKQTILTSNTYTPTRNFINKSLYFVQGNISIYGAYCTNDGEHSGCGYGEGDNPFGDVEGMDVIHGNDLEVFEELPTCSATDIPCHLNRIVKSVQDVFVRFGNYFRDFTKELKKSLIELFIPPNDYFEDFFEDLSDSVEQQLGFLSYPIVLLSDIFNRFYNLERSSHITYSGFEYPPNSNNLLIPAFDLDLDTLVASGSMYTLYNIYFVFINGLFCFMFLRLCVKKFNQIFGGGAL